MTVALIPHIAFQTSPRRSLSWPVVLRLAVFWGGDRHRAVYTRALVRRFTSYTYIYIHILFYERGASLKIIYTVSLSLSRRPRKRRYHYYIYICIYIASNPSPKYHIYMYTIGYNIPVRLARTAIRPATPSNGLTTRRYVYNVCVCVRARARYPPSDIVTQKVDP